MSKLQCSFQPNHGYQLAKLNLDIPTDKMRKKKRNGRRMLRTDKNFMKCKQHN